MRTNFEMMVECFESLRYRVRKNLEVNLLNIDVGEAEALIFVLDDVLDLCWTRKCGTPSLMYDYAKGIIEHIDDYKESNNLISARCDLYLSWCKVLEVANTFIK